MYNYRERIRKILAVYSITLQEFCNRIGLNSTTTISKIIAENRKPSQKTIGRIIKAFPDISYNWLVLGEGTIDGAIVKEETKGEVTAEDVTTAFLEAKNYTETIYKQIMNRLDEDRLHYVEAREQMNRDLRREFSLLSEKIKNEDRLYFDKMGNKRLDAILDQFISMKKQIVEYASSGTHKITEKIDNALNENAKLTAVAIEKILRMEQDLETITLVLASEYELDKIKANKKTNGKTKSEK